MSAIFSNVTDNGFTDSVTVNDSFMLFLRGDSVPDGAVAELWGCDIDGDDDEFQFTGYRFDAKSPMIQYVTGSGTWYIKLRVHSAGDDTDLTVGKT